MFKLTRGTIGRVMTSGSIDDEASDLVRGAIAKMAPNRDKNPNQDINWDRVGQGMSEARNVLIDEIKKASVVEIKGDVWRARTTISLGDHGIKRDSANKLQFEMKDVPADYFHAAPANAQRQNRFNGPMEEALYVGTSMTHLAQEMAQDCLYGDFLIARFHLEQPCGQFLSILTEDTTTLPGLNALAMESERSRLNSLAAGQANPYVGTQWLRHLLDAEFPAIDGVIYPPVHGSFSRYSDAYNIAVISDDARNRIYEAGPAGIVRRSLDVGWTKDTWLC